MFSTRQQHHNPSPEESANIFSKLTFFWLRKLIRKGRKRLLKPDDLYDLHKDNQVSNLYKRYEKVASKYKREHWNQFTVWIILFRVYGLALGLPGFLLLLCECFDLVNPLLLHELVAFLERYPSSKESVYMGYLYAFLLLLCPILSTICLQQYMYCMMRAYHKIRSSLMEAAFRKMLRLSALARQSIQSGEIFNIMSVDSERISEAISWIHFGWEAPLVILVSSSLVCLYFGWVALVGVGSMLLMLPLTMLVGWYFGKAQDKSQLVKDERVKVMNEMLRGIRVVKFFTWEKRFKKRIEEIRKREHKHLRTASLMEDLQNFISALIPILGSSVTFIMFAAMGGKLETAQVFATLSLFKNMEGPIYLASFHISTFISAFVSGKRIAKFMSADEVEPYLLPKPNPQKEITETTRLLDAEDVPHEEPPLERNVVLSIKNATFSWTKDALNPTLKNIDLKVKKGQLICITGSVGSGKSSLLSAIFGDIPKLRGTVWKSGKIAYCAQTPWLVNATVRENILFGRPYDAKRYFFVCKACQLIPDFDLMPLGDRTEVGEGGLNLSGGQKHRISLARACYANADIYLLDSVLSAVDAHVARYLFHQCILKFLKDKTRILVTHAAQFLPFADLVIEMRNGSIFAMGTYEDLRRRYTDFSTGMMDLTAAELLPPRRIKDLSTAFDLMDQQIQKLSKKQEEESKGRLTTEEELVAGGVNWGIYKEYFKRYGGWIFLCIIAAIFFRACTIGSGAWLAFWSSNKWNLGLTIYLSVYSAFGICSALGNIFQSIGFTFGNLRTATRLHNQMLHCILRAPILFFDQTPIGRILNRFSKDQIHVDSILGYVMNYMLGYVLNIIAVIAMVCVITPPTLIIVIPVIILYYFMQKIYRKVYLQVSRLEKVTRSPIYSHFAACISGVSTIRAYGYQKLMISESEKKIDKNVKAAWMIITLNRWFGTRVQFLSSLIVFGTCVFGLLLIQFELVSWIGAPLIALSVTYSLTIAESFNWLIRFLVEAEAGLISVERMINYTKLKSEAPAIIPENRPPANWPSHGEIEFLNVKMRYRPDLDLVLKGITCKIRGGEKVGIVGRTGSGKSSLLLCLFRMVELVEGRIMVDNVDIREIGLEDLRSKLTIIPQDPTIFSGTLRNNIDPFDHYQDSEIWKALEAVHLKESVQRMPLQLMEPVSEYGENLSIGERQLLCLARCLLKKNKIIILDEATANVDVQSDQKIQRAIRETFQNETVLTIAHRLETIIDYDRVMIMSDGRLVEYDSPKNLLSDENSMFSKLVAETGEAFANRLRAMAERKIWKSATS